MKRLLLALSLTWCFLLIAGPAIGRESDGGIASIPAAQGGADEADPRDRPETDVDTTFTLVIVGLTILAIVIGELGEQRTRAVSGVAVGAQRNRAGRAATALRVDAALPTPDSVGWATLPPPPAPPTRR